MTASGRLGIPPGVERRRPTGEAGHGEVEAAPEEMNRADLAQKCRAELLQHPIGGEKGAVKPFCASAIVAARRSILGEADGRLDLVGRRMDRNVAAALADQGHERGVEVRHRRRAERDRRLAAPVDQADTVTDQIDHELERFAGAIERRGAQATRSHSQSEVPTVVAPRQQGRRNLADDLADQVQCHDRRAIPVARQ